MLAKGGRVCCWCGKDGSQGESLAAFTTLRNALLILGVKLRDPRSRYFDPRCARKAQARLAKAKGE